MSSAYEWYIFPPIKEKFVIFSKMSQCKPIYSCRSRYRKLQQVKSLTSDVRMLTELIDVEIGFALLLSNPSTLVFNMDICKKHKIFGF